MIDQVRKYGAFAIVLAASVWLIRFPVADCFDCEMANAWGQNDHIRDERALAAFILILGLSLLAGIVRPRFYWIVPAAVVTAYVLTMHLGGTAWWSIRNNEGPIALAFGLPASYLALAVGIILNLLLRFVRRPKHAII